MLSVSTRSKYGLRALLRIASIGPDERISATSIASSEGIPAKYLESILASLSRAGLVSGMRGKEGGYRLSKDPRSMSLLEVIVALEGASIRYYCDEGGTQCAKAAKCVPHKFWEELEGALNAFLESKTLDDLIVTEAPRRDKHCAHHGCMDLILEDWDGDSPSVP
jgi:Rrf2 family protein